MKIIAIGDTHGRDVWKKIVEKEADADRIVFIGDYFDTFNLSLKGHTEMNNFKEIVQLKRDNPDKVVLLIGNHDFHYMDFARESYSGYNMQFAVIFSNLLYDARDVMKICHIEEGCMFTHAGVTNRWLADNNITVDGINELFKTNPDAFRFYRGDKSQCGDNWHQSPIWVRPEALVSDAQLDYIQVVGHTHQPTVTYYNGAEPAKVILIDCLDNVHQYLVVEDGVPRTETLFTQ